jgi:hypothetical protein
MKVKIKSMMCSSLALMVFAIPLQLHGGTSKYLYRPFASSDNHQPLKVSKTLQGMCRAQSPISKREDAWTCYAEGQQYDPCFVKRFGKRDAVICPTSPWSSEATEIKLNTNLVERHEETLDMSRSYPWALELDSGLRCMAIESDGRVDGLAVHYKCSDKGYLIGHLQRCKAKWTMLHSASGHPTTVFIAKAWF